MKRVAKLLLLAVILTACFSMVGCANLFEPKWFAINSKFSVTIEGVSGWDTLDLQISKSYWITVSTLDGSRIDYSDVQIEHNEENTAILSSYDARDMATFDLYCYDLSSGDELKITYKGETVKVNYSVVDFDFEANGYETITSIDALDKYREVKEMILSIQYHEFEEPFIGLDDAWRSHDFENDKYGKMMVYNRDCIHILLLRNGKMCGRIFLGNHTLLFLIPNTNDTISIVVGIFFFPIHRADNLIQKLSAGFCSTMQCNFYLTANDSCLTFNFFGIQISKIKLAHNHNLLSNMYIESVSIFL